MRDDYRPQTGENQAPDLCGCAWIAIPGTGIRLLAPTRDTSKRLEAKFDVPARIKSIRQTALETAANRNEEIFAQKNFRVGHTTTGLVVVLTISLLTTHRAWRGGWFAALVPPEEEEAFQDYLRTARNDVVADLRQERARGGSLS